ncbi:MAG: response regulator transcription factor [Gammaproteobacteria bacterium]|nr:response regulator transcription factor [Gammaproteobacteria bacterium]MDP6734461.1 response regulator transcription factor [Gammaproteobacteria bacterium]
MTRIQTLLVEDNQSLAETVISYLELEGIDCDHAATGPRGLELASTNHYQSILLDINLPRMDGLQVCEALRKRGVDVPVLMLTARDTLDDKLAGFEAGTDDYLVKPFELSELTARVRALAKRRSSQTHKLEVGPLILDLSLKFATRDGQPIKLTPTGWKLLELLMRESPNVVSRVDMEHAVWGSDQPDSNVLKVHLYKLRDQVDKPFDSKLIHTIARHGVALRVSDA